MNASPGTLTCIIVKLESLILIPDVFFKTYLIDVLKFMFRDLEKKAADIYRFITNRIQQLDGFYRMEHQCGATTRLARFGYRSLRIEG